MKKVLQIALLSVVAMATASAVLTAPPPAQPQPILASRPVLPVNIAYGGLG